MPNLESTPMRLAVLSSSLLALAFAGCQTAPPSPPAASVPHAKLSSSHVDVDNDRTDIFRVLALDGRETIDATDMTPRTVEIDHSELVVAGKPAHVAVDARAFYTNAARRLFWDSMAVKGTIEFTPEADAVYVMRGSLTPDQSSVWIENGATHAIVGNRISIVGRGTANAAAAASAAEQSQASHPIGER